jgi:hypothetical protein
MVKLIHRCACLILVGSVAVASAATTEVSPTKLPVPTISSVSKITTAQHQTITIKGKGFGTFHAYTGDSRFIWLRELKGDSSTVLWEAGYSKDGDTVTLIVEKWTNTEIVLGGFAGKWNEPGYDFTLHKGDTEQIRVWNWQGNPPSSPSAYFKVAIQ